jgi:hypothetical protein
MIYTDSFIAGIKPDPLISVSEWADTNRVLLTFHQSLSSQRHMQCFSP